MTAAPSAKVSSVQPDCSASWAPKNEAEILQAAETILRGKLERLASLASPTDTCSFLRMRLGHLLHEEFHVIWLDNRHRILAVERMFIGTIDGTPIHPREVVRSALAHNAAAAILAHNHPSGVAEPSAADRSITNRLKEALDLVCVRVLDHIVVGATATTSMAERGWI
jgi:DNA repair protein RadC